MTLRTYLEQRGMTVYRLSKESGVPKTTVTDICSGKTKIENCNAKTVFLLARALECSMEELMTLESVSDFDQDGLPLDQSYHECGLPPYLQESLEDMKKCWLVLDSGGDDLHKDVYWCALNADINSAEVDRRITSAQASYLRKKYLRM